MIAITKTICEIAREEPSSKRVFERYGIDYCCDGSIPLAEACTAKKLELETVVAALEAAARNAAASRARVDPSVSGKPEWAYRRDSPWLYEEITA